MRTAIRHPKKNKIDLQQFITGLVSGIVTGSDLSVKIVFCAHFVSGRCPAMPPTPIKTQYTMTEVL